MTHGNPTRYTPSDLDTLTHMQLPSLPFDCWLAAVEDAISAPIASCVPRDWNEDYITRRWLQNVTAAVGAVEVTGAGAGFAVKWDAYKVTTKATGAGEENFGDVAVLVRLTLPSGRATEGVGFLEAKRIYSETDRYDSIKWDQLKRHLDHTTPHRVLLYDVKHIHEAPATLPAQAYCSDCNGHPYTDVRAAALPTAHVLAQHVRTRQLHESSVPLGYQLCCRYLRGLDLDPTVKLVAAVKRGVPGGVAYLLVVDVAEGPDRQPDTRALGVDLDAHSPIDIHPPEAGQ